MVTHDYERGMITGLPRSVVDEVRRIAGDVDQPTAATCDICDGRT